MEQKNNILTIFVTVIITAIIVGGSVYIWQQKTDNISSSPITSNTTKEPIKDTTKNTSDSSEDNNVAKPDATDTKTVSTKFEDDLLTNLPSKYITSKNSEYLESFGSSAEKAIVVKPCETDNLDPTKSPLCFTQLTIVDKGKTQDLDSYIKSDQTLNSYEKTQGGKLIKSTSQNNIPFVYTSKPFMCIGTGGGGCMRQRYVYHLSDSRNIMAEISFMPYKNGEYVTSPIKEVQDIITVYENLLTK